MKKGLFVFLLIGMLCSSTQAQKLNDSTKSLNDRELGLYYLKQSKKQKTIAWILLGAGLTMEVIGNVQYNNEDIFSESSSGETLMLIGSLSTIASVPFFIMGAKNKGRAEILLRNQNIPLGHSGSRLLSVGVALPLGR